LLVEENEDTEVRARKRRRSQEQIAELVREFTASGRSQRKFCEDRGIALSELQRGLKIVRRASELKLMTLRIAAVAGGNVLGSL
jgi:hypothetical protein